MKSTKLKKMFEMQKMKKKKQIIRLRNNFINEFAYFEQFFSSTGCYE